MWSAGPKWAEQMCACVPPVLRPRHRCNWTRLLEPPFRLSLSLWRHRTARAKLNGRRPAKIPQTHLRALQASHAFFFLSLARSLASSSLFCFKRFRVAAFVLLLLLPFARPQLTSEPRAGPQLAQCLDSTCTRAAS